MVRSSESSGLALVRVDKLMPSRGGGLVDASLRAGGALRQGEGGHQNWQDGQQGGRHCVKKGPKRFWVAGVR